MVKTTPQRQAAYRERHLKDESANGERLNLVVNLLAKRALERLAVCYAVTQKEIIERLAPGTQRVTLNKAESLPNGPQDYYDGSLWFGFDDVTQ